MHLIDDFRSAARRLLRNWRLSGLVALILALGIGATTVVFSVADTLVLSPLPYPEADELVVLWGNNPARDIERFSVSGDDYLDWLQRTKRFDALAAAESRSVSLTGRGEPERLVVTHATASFADVFGFQTAEGRWFTPAEEDPGAASVVVLSPELRARLFPQGSAWLGETITLDDNPYQVIGVMPRDLAFPFPADAWTPLELAAVRGNRDNRNYTAFGRMHDGVTLGQAQAEMDVVTSAMERDYPNQNKGWGAFVEPLDRWVTPVESRTTVWLLFGAVLLVVGVVCANVGGLLLADAEARRREWMIRAAIGAGRGGLIRAALVESLVLAAVGGGLGVALAIWGVALVRAQQIADMPLLNQVAVDLRVLAFAGALSVLTAFVFGLAPALYVTRRDLQSGLREGGRSLTAGPARQWARSALTVGQLALACSLLVGAGLALTSLDRLRNAPVGFSAQNVLTFETAPPFSRYPDGSDWTAFHRRLMDELRAAPNVESVGLSSGLPLSGGNTSINFATLEPSTLAPGETLQVDWRIVSPGFFETLGVPIVEGRPFRESDQGGDGADTPVVVSQETARRLWPNQDAVGHGLTLGESNFRIIGVAGDVRESKLSSAGDPAVYIPYTTWRWMSADTALRYRGDAAAAADLVRKTVSGIDPELPVFNLQTMDEMVEAAAAEARLTARLLGAFALSAALLAMLGVYGLIARNVEQRTNEFGVRLALGARSRALAGMVMSRGSLLLAGGLALGVPGGWALSQAMRSALYQTSPDDPAVYAIVVALLAAVAALGSLRPALRVARLDPAAALRHD